MGNLGESWIKNSLGCGAPGPFSPVESGSAFHRLAFYSHMFWCEKNICPHSCWKRKWRWDFRSKDQLQVNHSALISFDSAFKEKFPDITFNVISITVSMWYSKWALNWLRAQPQGTLQKRKVSKSEAREKGKEIPSSGHDAAFAIRNSQQLRESALGLHKVATSAFVRGPIPP